MPWRAHNFPSVSKRHPGARRARLGMARSPATSAKTPATLRAGRLESEADMGPRFESERAAISEASKKVCHSMIPHALALRSEIDKALAAAKRLEDATPRCKKLGIKRNGVRTCGFFKPCGFNSTGRTIDLKPICTSQADGALQPVVSQCRGFLDLSSCKTLWACRQKQPGVGVLQLLLSLRRAIS